MELELLVADGHKVTLQDWCTRDNKRPSVIDFWNTRCTQCPPALTKLNSLASMYKDVFFGACSLAVSTAETVDQTQELLEDDYPNLHHAHMTFEVKELLKEALEFKVLPFCLVYAEGRIVWKGDPRSSDFIAVLKKTVSATDVCSTQSQCAPPNPPCG